MAEEKLARGTSLSSSIKVSCEGLGGAYLSSSISVFCKRLVSHQVLDLFRRRKLDKTLLNKLIDELVQSIDHPFDTELEDVVFEAEGLLDEIDYALLREVDCALSECIVEAKSQTSAKMKIESRVRQVLRNLKDLDDKRNLEPASRPLIIKARENFVKKKRSSKYGGREVSEALGYPGKKVFDTEALGYPGNVKEVSEALGYPGNVKEVSEALGYPGKKVFDTEALGYLGYDKEVLEALGYPGKKVFDTEALGYPGNVKEVSEALRYPGKKVFDTEALRYAGKKFFDTYKALSKLPPYNLEHTNPILGRQKEKDQVMKFFEDLSNFDDENTNIKTNMPILGIVGIGGIGKTTLARAVYEDDKVRQWFEQRVWVTFPSYQLDAVTLAKIILRVLQVSFDQDEESLDPMISHLQESLSEKRSLLVLDGCCSVHEWKKLRTCFESAARGSAIMLTTRATEAAFQMLVDHVLHLNFLSMEHCWSLFSEHCFGNESLSCSPQLEAVGKRILSKCRGVPLAAKMLGGLLYKKDYKAWEKIWKSQLWDSTNFNLPTPFVRLCYLDLPEQLKRCITYLAIFPRGCKFHKRHVVLLWKAKCLIQQGNGETMERLGNEYFDFLVARALLIRSGSGGDMDFVMHDIVRDLALFVFAKFYDSSLDETEIAETIDASCVISNIKNVEQTSSQLYDPQVEEYTPFKVNTPTTTNNAVQNEFEFKSHFETLRIVDASQLPKLPSTVHSLRIEGCHSLESLKDVLTNRSTHLLELYIIDCCSLKYFSDPSDPTSLNVHPTSLRTLYVHKCRKLEFIVSHEKIQSFVNLEHLFMGSSYDSLKSFPLNLFPKLKILCIWDCPNLEYLSVEESQNTNLSLESLEIRDCSNFLSFPTKGLLSPNLRSLSVSNCKKLRSLPNHMATLTSLQTLFVLKCPELESLPVGGLPSCLKLLSIALCDKLIPQKEWNLRMTLHCLRRFEIEGGCIGIKSFPEKDILPVNLNSLYISKLPSLEVLDHNGLEQLTALESLEINCCKKLYSLPEVLPSSLTFLCIKESSVLSQKLLNEGSEDWLKIAHICNIQIDNNVISRNNTGASLLSRNGGSDWVDHNFGVREDSSRLEKFMAEEHIAVKQKKMAESAWMS